MLFNSYEFIFVFLPIALIGYFMLAKYRYTKLATAFLVLISLAFYAQWNISYLPLLLLSILFNYFMGTWIEKTRELSALIFGIGTNLALLGYYKYTGFLLSSYNTVFSADFPVPEIVLPLGISFFTFTQTAYLIDAYRGETKGYTFLNYSLFVTVFPHLIAGPILYHKTMIPQFSRLRNFVFSYKNMAMGITMFSIGLFKKVVIADTLAPWVKLAFDHADQLTFIEAWLGAVGYTLQLYFDFSGYSEMALGLGLMLNFKLPVNFDSPYKSTSIIEFWRRWHISLSEFLKNYLYIPLGGNRQGDFYKMRNLMITMLLGGLWHGAGWTFVIWGGLHGLFLVINHQWRKLDLHLPKAISWGITFLCVMIAWVFFRADTVGDALMVLKAMANIGNIVTHHLVFSGGRREVLWLIGGLWIVVCWKNAQERLAEFKPNWAWAWGIGILLTIALLKTNQVSEFLYFQF